MVQLVEDVLMNVFTFCDICSVLSASRASRHLHAIAFSKQVWSALVFDLQQRFFLDVPLGTRLDDYSTDALVDLVKGIVNGPRSWTTSQGGPKIARQVILKPDIQHGQGILDWENQPQLLQGGAFVFYENWGKLECWAVETKTLIWTYVPENSRWVDTFALEPTDNGQCALVMIGIRDYANVYGDRKKFVDMHTSLFDLKAHDSLTSFVEIFHLNLSTATSRRLFDERAPDSDNFDNPFTLLRIQGDHAIAVTRKLELQPQQIMLFQLSDVTTRTLRVPDDHDVDLLSGNLVMVSPDIHSPHKLLEIRLWRMATLCHSVIDASIDTIGPLISTSIKLTKPCYRPPFRLSAHPSPLCSNHSIIWILTSSSTPKFTLIRKYHVSHEELEPLTMRCTNSRDLKNATKGVPYESSRISYAGYADVPAMRVKLHSLSNPDVDDVHFQLPDRGEYVHLSAYSGALTYATQDNVVVNYYE